MKWIHFPILSLNLIGHLQFRLMGEHSNCNPDPYAVTDPSNECVNETFKCNKAICCELNCPTEVQCQTNFQCGGGFIF